MLIRPVSNVHELFNLIAGDDWIFEVSCSNSDGTPIDLTAAAIEYKLATAAGGVVRTLTIGNGITVVPPEAPATYPTKCIVLLPHADSALIAPGAYRDQLRVTVGGLVSTQSKGDLTVTAPL